MQVGDVVMVCCEDTVPADIVVVKSAREDALCYIQTASLDGETNLKPRIALADAAFALDQIIDSGGEKTKVCLNRC